MVTFTLLLLNLFHLVWNFLLHNSFAYISDRVQIFYTFYLANCFLCRLLWDFVLFFFWNSYLGLWFIFSKSFLSSFQTIITILHHFCKDLWNRLTDFKADLSPLFSCKWMILMLKISVNPYRTLNSITKRDVSKHKGSCCSPLKVSNFK
jgi:hypothetical protein